MTADLKSLASLTGAQAKLRGKPGWPAVRRDSLVSFRKLSDGQRLLRALSGGAPPLRLCHPPAPNSRIFLMRDLRDCHPPWPREAAAYRVAQRKPPTPPYYDEFPDERATKLVAGLVYTRRFARALGMEIRDQDIAGRSSAVQSLLTRREL